MSEATLPTFNPTENSLNLHTISITTREAALPHAVYDNSREERTSMRMKAMVRTPMVVMMSLM
jgi:hypothetical protein